MTAVTTLAGDYFDGEPRRQFVGLQTATAGVSGLCFLLIGGLLSEVSWRATFLTYCAALLLLPLILRDIHDVSPQRGPGQQVAPKMATKTCMSLTVLFVAAMFSSVAFFMTPTQIPFLLAAGERSLGPRAGLAIGLMPLSMAASSFAISRFQILKAPVLRIAIGFGLMAAGYVAMSASSSYTLLLCSVLIAGFGVGVSQPAFTIWALEAARPERRGRIAGTLTASLYVGQFMSPLVVQPLITASSSHAAFRTMGILLFTASLVALLTWTARLFWSRQEHHGRVT
jgi:hypothetical protein